MADSNPIPPEAKGPAEATLQQDPRYKYAHSGYKGHARGILGGAMIGLLIGTGVATAFLGFAALGLFGVEMMALQSSTILSIYAACVGVGSMVGSELFGNIHEKAAMLGDATNDNARMIDAAVLQMKKLQLTTMKRLGVLTPEEEQQWEKQITSYEDAHKHDHDKIIGRHHFENPLSKPKIFHMKTGLIGIATGAIIGLAIGISIFPESLAIIGMEVAKDVAAHGTAHGALAALMGPLHIISPLGVAALLGSFGATFGIDRGFFKSILNFTEDLFGGKVRKGLVSSLAETREYFNHPGMKNIHEKEQQNNSVDYSPAALDNMQNLEKPNFMIQGPSVPDPATLMSKTGVGTNVL